MHQLVRLCLTDGEAEHEFGALSWLRLEPYDTIKFRHYHFTNNKSEANTICARLILEDTVLAK